MTFFFKEEIVYICIKYINDDSINKLYNNNVSKEIFETIALSIVIKLKLLKNKHNIIYRNVKSTNILMNIKK